jgi:hypothetical protein
VTFAAPVRAQEPPDTLPPDTLALEPLPPDSLLADNLAATQDVPDSLVFHSLPAMAWGSPAGFSTGVWFWDREALLSTRAQTLTALLAEVPGILSLVGGDYGTPEAVSAFALGGGGVRVFADGFEMLPLDGGVPDLSRFGLGGLQSVRVERGMGEVQVHLESLRLVEARPLSIVEAGTGDLDTNHFRGTFLHPRLFGGSVGFNLERLDTRGRRGAEPGARVGTWLRYTMHRGDDAGIGVELRRHSSETEVAPFPGNVSRSDLILRGRLRLAPGLVAEAFTGRSSLEGEDDGLTPIRETRRQHGLRASLDRQGFWVRGGVRVMGGADLPSSSYDLAGGASRRGVGGVAARWNRDSWEGEGTAMTSVQAWTDPVFGLSAFASYESGRRGTRLFQPRVPIPPPPDPDDEEEEEEPPPEEPAPPASRITERTGLRAGASLSLGPWTVSAAYLRLETDSLIPLGIQLDREGVAMAGLDVSGLEVATRLALPLSGFGLYGSVQEWKSEARYLPERTYQGGLDFHDLFLESGNLEVWGSLGVEGRDPMLLPLSSGVDGQGAPIPVRSPFFQSWHAFIQARIVTVRVFIHWENFTVRRNNQDFPDRILPETRATYGIRWTLWN